MVRYKIGFEIDAETLFGMLAKMLPIDNLSVEEIAPPAPVLRERIPTPHLDKALGLTTVMHQSETPPIRRRRRRIGKETNLKQGINRILMEVLADGQPHHAATMRGPLKTAGFSENSVGSRLQALRQKGVVKQIGDGTWQLASS